MNKYRTHNCGELTKKNNKSNVVLSGWINKKRDHGNLLFLDLRDNYGITQCLVDKENKFFKELETNPSHPQTSQPTPGDFRRQYQFLQSHYDSIISIHIPHELSGTYQSAVNAAKRVENTKINPLNN